MPWNDVAGQRKRERSRESLPILAIRPGSVVRLRLLAGPGHLAEPSETHAQHWPSGQLTAATKLPFRCIGRDCIFHSEPLLYKQQAMSFFNCRVYEVDEQPRNEILLLASVTLIAEIKRAAAKAGIPPARIVDHDVVVRRGSGAMASQFAITVTHASEPVEVDLSQVPDAEPEFAADASPKLVDWLKLPSMRMMTPDQQSRWHDTMVLGYVPQDEVTPRAAADAVAAEDDVLEQDRLVKRVRALAATSPSLADMSAISRICQHVSGGRYHRIGHLGLDELRVLSALVDQGEDAVAAVVAAGDTK